MGRSGRMWRGMALAAVVLTSVPGLLVPTPGTAQDPGDVRVGLTYRPGYLPALAVAPVRNADGSLASLAAGVDSILRRDLDFSDRFEIVPVPDSLETDRAVRYELWNALGAVWLVRAELSGSPARPLLRVSLHDVVYGRLEEVEALTLPSREAPDFRMAVHRVSDRLVRWATGEPGMAASRIAFRRRSPDGSSDIWMVDSDGHGLRRVTRDSSIVYSPAFSPDGSRLLYVSYRPEDRPVVYERELSTGRTRVVSDVPGVNLTPAYRPDGRRIMVARSVRDRSTDTGTEIFELEAETLCCAERITFTSPGDALNPSYSPDGRRFAHEATPLGEQQVYVQRVEGGGVGLISRYLYGERGSSAAPGWSPRGDRIAYQAWIDGTFQIATVNPDGTDRRILTSEGTNEEPSWAPDSRHLVFRSTRGGYHALWVLDTVTGSLRRLVANQQDQTPDWSGPLGPSEAGGVAP